MSKQEESDQETEMTLGDVLEAAESNEWWREIIGEVDRRWMLRQANVPTRHKVETVHALFESSFIGPEKLASASTDAIFQEARSLIKNLSAGEKYPEQLYNLYEKQKPRALEELDRIACEIISFLAISEHQQRFKEEWNRRTREIPVAEQLLATVPIRDWNERYVVRSLCDLAETDYFVRHSPSPFATDEYFPMQIGEERIERYEYLAYRVFDPLWNLDRKRFEREFVSFPLKWAGILPSNTLDELYVHHRTGGDVLVALTVHYDQVESLDRLSNAISTCPVTKCYGPLFNEVVGSYRKALFKVCSFSLLALVEGLLWAYVWWWNRFHGPVFDRNLSVKQYRERTFQLNTKAGKSVSADIGTLLRQTAFGDHFYYEAVEYFCQELFAERNPVLHGRDPSYGDKRKAATLLFVVENIERQITDTFKEAFAQEIMEAIDKGGEAVVKDQSQKD